jgi:dTDP-4-amino-4,6-dideoxygalactose transaminase
MIVAGIKPGDEVICPSLSYIASSNSILYVGATPVFAEIDPATYNLDIRDVERRITPKTRAILLVHQIGMPADIDAFRALAEKHGIVLIEDAACAIGSAYKGKRIGSHSELVCFSFHPRKVISTGDGGMITTRNPQFAERLRLLRQHGMSVSPQARHQSSKIIFEDHVEVGYNYRLTDIQAAVGIEQMARLDGIVAGRRAIAQQYNKAFGDLDAIILPIEKEGCFSNYQSYSVILKENCPISRNDLMQSMLEEGVSTRRGVMTSHREPAYATIAKGVSLPVTEHTCDNSIILPLYVPMEQADTDRVIEVFRKYVR